LSQVANAVSHIIALLARRFLSIELKRYCLHQLSVCLSVCLHVWKVYCRKTADWIRMPFKVVSGVGLGMGVLN